MTDFNIGNVQQIRKKRRGRILYKNVKRKRYGQRKPGNQIPERLINRKKRCLTLLITREMQNKVRNGYNFKSKDTIWGNIKLPKMWGKCNLYASLAGEGKTGAAILGTNWGYLVVGTKGILILYCKPLCINPREILL